MSSTAKRNGTRQKRVLSVDIRYVDGMELMVMEIHDQWVFDVFCVPVVPCILCLDKTHAGPVLALRRRQILVT